jgi:epoxyqueuosine reductase
MLSSHKIKEFAYELGFDTARITTADAFPEAKQVIQQRIDQGLMDGLPWFTSERAEVSCRPDALMPTAKSIISLGMVYLSELPQAGAEADLGLHASTNASPSPRGSISRYAWGDDYHEMIKPKLQRFARWLQEYAYSEMPDAVETRLFVDTGRMVDRAVAQRAGLGWYGKNTNILTKAWGSWIFLAEIVTNIPLPPDTPLKASCGNCEICLHACPTQALPHAYELDTPRCISFLTIELRGSIPIELRPLMGNLIFGCDICQQVCPVNILAEKRLGLHVDPTIISSTSIKRRNANQPSFSPHEELRPRTTIGSNPELIPLLSLTEEQFRDRFHHSPIKRTKRRGLLRNVCVALGNSGDIQAVPALIGALHDTEPLVRGHAAWALGRLRTPEALQALQNALSTEEDETARKEIHLALQSSLPPYN